MKGYKQKAAIAIMFLSFILITVSGFKIHQLNKVTQVKVELQEKVEAAVADLEDTKDVEDKGQPSQQVSYLDLMNKEYNTDKITSAEISIAINTVAISVEK